MGAVRIRGAHNRACDSPPTLDSGVSRSSMDSVASFLPAWGRREARQGIAELRRFSLLGAHMDRERGVMSPPNCLISDVRVLDCHRAIALISNSELVLILAVTRDGFLGRPAENRRKIQPISCLFHRLAVDYGQHRAPRG